MESFCFYKMTWVWSHGIKNRLLFICLLALEKGNIHNSIILLQFYSSPYCSIPSSNLREGITKTHIYLSLSNTFAVRAYLALFPRPISFSANSLFSYCFKQKSKRAHLVMHWDSVSSQTAIQLLKQPNLVV